MTKKVIGGEGEPRAVEKRQGNEQRVDEVLMGPGDYEVTKDHTFEIPVHLKLHDKRWVVMAGPGKDVITQKVEMRLWSYDEMVDLRKKATSYDQIKRIHMVDQDLLNRLKIQKLMISWTFGDTNPRLKIHRQQDSLTDESWLNVKKLQTNILQYIINTMNEVYELNG